MKVLYNDGHVGEIDESEELHVIRHSASHILAQAIKRLYPEADFGYGPATDNGFYYDIDLPEGTKISEDDFYRLRGDKPLSLRKFRYRSVKRLKRDEVKCFQKELCEHCTSPFPCSNPS